MTSVFNASAAKSVLNWNWITLSGKDARDFLHRVTTVHVNALQVGQGAPGFFLSAQGKVRSYFTLWNFGDQDYAFEFDAGSSGKWKQELLSAIDQYTFAEKMTLTDVSGLECRWIFDHSFGLNVHQTTAIDEEIRLCRHSDEVYGRVWVSAWGRPARLAQWLERAIPEATVVSFETLEEWRIRQLSPRMDAEITSDTIPLEVGLVNAIGENKGCYPGQEVIERITALGSPARRLALLEGTGPAPQTGSSILNLADPPAEIGTLTSVHRQGDSDSFLALGFVRKIHAKEGLNARFGTSNAQASVSRVAPYIKKT